MVAQSDVEKRAKAAARAKAYRDRRNAERDAERAVDAAKVVVGTVTVDEVEKSLGAMKWLVASDAAAVSQARQIARIIDELEGRGSFVAALNAHGRLTRVLAQLGGTPTVRMAHELRSLKAASSTEAQGGDEGSDVPSTGTNVTKFQRPAKRTGS